MCPGCGEPLARARVPRGDRGARRRRSARSRSPASAATRRFSMHDRRRPRAGAARARAVGRDRREAHAARRARVHAPGRRRHGERGPAGGAPHRGARRARHVHPAEQRRVRRDRRPHDRDQRASASARRTRSTAATPSTTATRSSSATCIAQLEGAAYVARGSVHNAGAVARTKKMFRRAFETQVARRGLLVRRGAHDVPDRLVHPDRRRPELHAARRSARCTSWAS